MRGMIRITTMVNLDKDNINEKDKELLLFMLVSYLFDIYLECNCHIKSNQKSERERDTEF